MFSKLFVTILCLLTVMHYDFVLAKDIVPKPKLMLAKVYHPNVDLNQYWVSEKYDGVRALWNGRHLVSRGGHIYHAPKWFTANFPAQRLDGELWIGRQQFERLLSIVRDKTPDDAGWHEVTYLVFDMPDINDSFDHRLVALRQLIKTKNIPWLQAVEQIKLPNHQALMQHLQHVTSQGAEGLMLHKGSSYYRGKRTGDLLKLKPYQDAEAKVIAHLPGKGKYHGMLGALRVQLKNGITFKIGSGFTDEQRRNPPAIGSVITYQFRGLSNKGVPKFATFLRTRKQQTE